MELQPRTLRRVLDRGAELFADHPALSRLGDAPLTFREVLEHATTVSAQLMELGVARGHRVAILSENMPSWGGAYFTITVEEVEATIQQSPYVLESLAVLLDGRLAARIHPDDARLDEEFGDLPVARMQQKLAALLEALRNEVNTRVSTFARLHKLIEQPEPFEKTPTQKVKRYLYVERQADAANPVRTRRR